MTAGHLQIIVCGAGPATDVHELIAAAHTRYWTAAVTATTSAVPFLDAPMIENLAGNPIRTGFQTPPNGQRTLPPADALIIAPATYNTINKLALGIADTYPLTSAAELIGRGIPTVIVPFVNAAVAARNPSPARSSTCAAKASASCPAQTTAGNPTRPAPGPTPGRRSLEERISAGRTGRRPAEAPVVHRQ